MPGSDRPAAVQAAQYIRGRIAEAPQIAVLTGTGLGDITASLADQAIIDYAQIPHFPVSTVPSHHGRLVLGRIGGCRLAVLQGRFHLYEGYSPTEVTFPIRVLQALGVRTLILTNASGGLDAAFSAGDIMLIADHINLTGANPLIGTNNEEWGPRFPDMTAVYDRRLRHLAQLAGDRMGVLLRTGVYVGLKGPSLETPAEIRFLRTIGADAVGFSTVMEAIAAVHAGMQILGISIITNIHLPDAAKPSSMEEIIAVAQQAAPRLERLITGVVADL